MRKGLIQNLSANAIQLIINQLLGLGIFYILSTRLNKNDFGQINLVLAVLLAVFNLLSFGIDQITIKKIASGADKTKVLSIYIYHVLITGLVFYGMILAGYYLFLQLNDLYTLLLLIAIGKLMIFFSTPFKQAANGMERFNLLASMSVISNVTRCCGLIILSLLHILNLHNIILVFICGDGTELLLGTYLFKRAIKIPVITKWDGTGYTTLLRESLPQTGVVLITSALARFDWIFIGFIVSAVKLAEYSFAYKVFEIATFPLLAIAPLLIPRFTKLFQQADIKVNRLKILIKAEMIVAAFTGLLLNLCWSPAIDKITSGKYGLINIKTIFILSLCMPLLYFNNFFWTIYFAQGRMKMILYSFIITFLVNITGDIVLIPYFKNEGAAFAFLAGCLVQTMYYLKKNTTNELKHIWRNLFFCSICALLSGFASEILFTDSWFIIPFAITLYIVLLFIMAQIKLSDKKSLRYLFNP